MKKSKVRSSIGASVMLAIVLLMTSCSQQSLPATQPVPSIQVVTVTPTLVQPTSEPTATRWPTIEAPIGIDGFPQYTHCYVEGGNNQWVIFKPHWEYGQKLWALNWANAEAKPILIIDTNASGQWSMIASDAAYVAAAQIFTNSRGQVAVYSLEENQQVASFETGYAPSVEYFDSDHLYFVAYDGFDTIPRWREVNNKNWELEFVERADVPSKTPAPAPEQAIEALQTKVTFCQSWH